MVDKITILCLVRGATPRDNVHGEAASAQMVERCELARSKGRGDETRSMRQQESQPPGDGRGICADEKAIWRIGKIAYQDAIEIRLLVDTSRRRDDFSIERRSGGCQDFR